MTAKQWEELNGRDSNAAADALMRAFSYAQSKAVGHYLETGDKRRAGIIQSMTPNVNELLGRVSYVASAQPDAQIEDVMRGYVIDASAELTPKDARGLSTREWFAELEKNPANANDQLRDIFRKVQAQAAEHYKTTGNTLRADFVAEMAPDMLTLHGRLETAKTAQPDAPVEAVVRGYIVDSSSQCCRAARH